MMQRPARRNDYTRICSHCAHHSVNGVGHHICNVPVDLVTGKPVPQSCAISRAGNGHCGPDGQRWVTQEVIGVTKPTEAAGNVVRIKGGKRK